MSDDFKNFIQWEKRIPLFTNIVVLKQLFLALMIPCCFLFLLISALDPDMIFDTFMTSLLVFGILAVLSVFAMAVIQLTSGGGLSATFSLNEKGMYYDAGQNSKSLNRITAAGGAMAGSLYLAGGSMINISRESEFMSWEEVDKITAYDSQKTIVAYRKILICPMGLFCKKENYDDIIKYIEKNLPKGVILEHK